MKLLDWLHPLEGMGQGVRAAGRPARLRSGTRRAMLQLIARVVVETDAGGDGREGLNWLLVDAEDRILLVVPGTAIDPQRLRLAFAGMPGFNRGALTRALRAEGRARYTVWRRQLPAAA